MHGMLLNIERVTARERAARMLRSEKYKASVSAMPADGMPLPVALEGSACPPWQLRTKGTPNHLATCRGQWRRLAPSRRANDLRRSPGHYTKYSILILLRFFRKKSHYGRTELQGLPTNFGGRQFS